jgi:hypothetical protein
MSWSQSRLTLNELENIAGPLPLASTFANTGFTNMGLSPYEPMPVPGAHKALLLFAVSVLLSEP